MTSPAEQQAIFRPIGSEFERIEEPPSNGTDIRRRRVRYRVVAHDECQLTAYSRHTQTLERIQVISSEPIDGEVLTTGWTADGQLIPEWRPA